jgi:hypothetical protein
MLIVLLMLWHHWQAHANTCHPHASTSAHCLTNTKAEAGAQANTHMPECSPAQQKDHNQKLMVASVVQCSTAAKPQPHACVSRSSQDSWQHSATAASVWSMGG